MATEIRIRHIIRATCEYYNITPQQLKGESRKREVARPRQIAMALSRSLTASSLPMIGGLFGGRHHATVLHAERTIKRLTDAAPDTQAISARAAEIATGELEIVAVSVLRRAAIEQRRKEDEQQRYRIAHECAVHVAALRKPVVSVRAA